MTDEPGFITEFTRRGSPEAALREFWHSPIDLVGVGLAGNRTEMPRSTRAHATGHGGTHLSTTVRPPPPAPRWPGT